MTRRLQSRYTLGFPPTPILLALSCRRLTKPARRDERHRESPALGTLRLHDPAPERDRRPRRPKPRILPLCDRAEERPRRNRHEQKINATPGRRVFVGDMIAWKLGCHSFPDMPVVLCIHDSSINVQKNSCAGARSAKDEDRGIPRTSAIAASAVRIFRKGTRACDACDAQ